MPYNSKEKLRAYLEKNKDHIRQLHVARARRWQEKNKVKAARLKRKWDLNNKEKAQKAKKEWACRNKSKRATWEAHRRALKFRATIYLTKEAKQQIEDMYKLAQVKTKNTGIKWHVDHIVPLTKSGLHKPTNLQVVPAIWNILKSNRNCDVYIEAE